MTYPPELPHRPNTAQTRSVPFSPRLDEKSLRDSLKRCSLLTQEAAISFHRTGELSYVPAIVTGIFERFVERDSRPKLTPPHHDVRLIEDLGIDSLTMMEIVLLSEEVLQIVIDNDELRSLRTLGDVHRFVEGKLRGLPQTPAALAHG